MTMHPIASDLQTLNESLSREEIARLVRERHPGTEQLSPFEFFTLTYQEVHGRELCETARRRLMTDYIAFCGCGGAPLYFARCLLPGHVHGSA